MYAARISVSVIEQLVTVYAARISGSVIVSWSCDQLLWHGKTHGKRLEFNDIQANYDTEIIDVIIIMDRGSENPEIQIYKYVKPYKAYIGIALYMRDTIYVIMNI